MLANVLKDKVIIQERVATQTAGGETTVYKPTQERYARVIPLDAKARAVYMQMQSEVTHKVVMRGSVTLNLGKNRLLWGSKILEPVEPVQTLDDKTSVVMVKEV